MKCMWLMLAMALVVVQLGWAEGGQPNPVWNDPAVAPPRDRVVHVVRPSQTDPRIVHFDDAHVVTFNGNSGAHPPLVVFMPGTGGKPEYSRLMQSVVANLGYRVIGLAYNDEPAVNQVCPRDPDPDCAAKFRQKRSFGNDVTSAIADLQPEAIVPRLVKLLQYLDVQYPAEHWGIYLKDGEPDWSRIVVSGQSQGAGMAAYIAKKKMVARVVLFSSPWDFYGRNRKLAPWLSEPSATPMDRWFAEYHQREKFADLLPHAYQMLGIPPANQRVFNGDPPADAKGDDPYHGTVVRLPVYIPDWQAMYGKALAQ